MVSNVKVWKKLTFKMVLILKPFERLKSNAIIIKLLPCLHSLNKNCNEPLTSKHLFILQNIMYASMTMIMEKSCVSSYVLEPLQLVCTPACKKYKAFGYQCHLYIYLLDNEIQD